MNPKDIYLSFDLDNTLINNHEGIINSFNYENDYPPWRKITS